MREKEDGTGGCARQAEGLVPPLGGEAGGGGTGAKRTPEHSRPRRPRRRGGARKEEHRKGEQVRVQPRRAFLDQQESLGYPFGRDGNRRDTRCGLLMGISAGEQPGRAGAVSFPPGAEGGGGD